MRCVLATLICLRAGAACVPVKGERIFVRDLAQASPKFLAGPQEQVVGFAPLPGAQRVFKAREVLSLSLRFGLTLEPSAVSDTCFVRETISLTPEDIREAMQNALTGRAQIEILDFSRYALPMGRIEFQLSGASRLSPVMTDDSPIFWRGRLVTESGHTFPVWAKARITVQSQILTAKTELPQGHILTAEDLCTARVSRSPLRDEVQLSQDAVIGKKLKRHLKSGEPFVARVLEEPKAVAEGDFVHVISINGQAEITFDARAETGGRKGDIILIQNPVNGHSFRSRVIEKGKVEAEALLQR